LLSSRRDLLLFLLLPLLLPVAVALAFLVAIPEGPVLSELEWRIYRCRSSCFLVPQGFSLGSLIPAKVMGRYAPSSTPRRSGTFYCSLSAFIFFPPFSAQKSHVKPPNHLTHYPAITSAWHVSSAQSAILDI
jgi:hypothetical protein